MTNKEAIAVFNGFKFLPREQKAVDLAIKALENKPRWIPVITKELSEEKIRFIEESDGMVDFDFGCGEWSSKMWKYESELPKDDQEVLITTKEGWIDIDKFHRDERNLCWFENHDNQDDVLAWMPLPQPYTKEDDT